MILSPSLSLGVVPVIYVLIERLRERKRQTGEVKGASDELVDATGAMSTATHNLGSRLHEHDNVR